MKTYAEQCGAFLCRGCGYRRIAGDAIRWLKGRRCSACGGETVWVKSVELPLIKEEQGHAPPGAYLCAFCEEFIAGEALTEEYWDVSEERFRCPACKRPLSWIERSRGRT